MHYRESALFQGLQRSLRQRERLKFFISNESSLVLPFRKVYFHVMLTFLFEIEKARCNYTTFFRYRETFTYYVLFRTTLFSIPLQQNPSGKGQGKSNKLKSPRQNILPSRFVLLNAISSANYSKVRTQKPNLNIPVFSLFHCSVHLHI